MKHATNLNLTTEMNLYLKLDHMHFWMTTKVLHELVKTRSWKTTYFSSYGSSPFFTPAPSESTRIMLQIKHLRNESLLSWEVTLVTSPLLGSSWRWRHSTNLRLLTICDFGGVVSISRDRFWGVYASESATVDNKVHLFSIAFLITIFYKYSSRLWWWSATVDNEAHQFTFSFLITNLL